ncbi:MAG: ImmA/IrrE family metallo-endopeptidase [Pyrinomonadaceae bacterium]
MWDGETLPVPVEHIADSCFGLHVRDVDDLSAAPGAPELGPGQALSGLLLPSLGEIWVNRGESERWPPRRRFTICHELGHWCMHRRDGGAIFCRSGTVEPKGEGAGEAKPVVPQIEEEAQIFAAALLMPGQLVRRYYEDGNDFEALCGIFNASRAAMGRRMHSAVPPEA